MRKIHFVRTLCFAVMLLVATCATSFAAIQDFTFINRSSETITAIHLVPKDNPSDRGNNVLGGTPLAPGESVSIHFDYNENQKYWGIDVDSSDGGTGDSVDYFDLSTTVTVTYTDHHYILN